MYATDICGILVSAADICGILMYAADYKYASNDWGILIWLGHTEYATNICGKHKYAANISGIHVYDLCIFFWEWKKWKNNLFYVILAFVCCQQTINCMLGILPEPMEPFSHITPWTAPSTLPNSSFSFISVCWDYYNKICWFLIMNWTLIYADISCKAAEMPGVVGKFNMTHNHKKLNKPK